MLKMVAKYEKKIESLNNIFEDVHVIPLDDINLQPTKCQRVELETLVDLEPMVEPDAMVEIFVKPPGSFKISGNSDGNENNEVCWKSTLILKDVID